MHHQPIQGPSPDASTGPVVKAYGVMYALRALERLAVGPHSIPELADTIGLGVRSTRRMLYRLREDGYVVQDGGHRRRFRTTPRLAALGALVLRDHPVVDAAVPALTDLARRTGATSALWISAGEHPVRVLRVDPDTAPARVLQLDPACAYPVRAVLAPARSGARSHAYDRQPGPASAATAVLDRGAVVAASEVLGDVDLGALGDAASAATAIGGAIAA